MTSANPPHASPPSGRTRSGARWLAGLSILVGGLIIAFSVPHVGAAFWLWLRAPVMTLINYRAPVPEAELRGLIASRKLALGWAATGETYADMAAAFSILASMREPGSPSERELLGRALAVARAGLARAPADPRGWTRLAYLRTLQADGPDEQAAGALQLSIRTGPYDRPDFLALRLHLAFLNWSLFDGPEERARVRRQIELLAEEGLGELAALAAEPQFSGLIFAALDDRPRARARLIAVMHEVQQEVAAREQQ